MSFYKERSCIFFKRYWKSLRIFKVVLLFNYQRSAVVFCLALTSDSFIILSFFILSVKHFFHFFEVSWMTDISCAVRSPSATFISYHGMFSKSRTFFKKFEEPRSQIKFWRAAVLSATLIILSSLQTNVNRFFYFFFNLNCNPFLNYFFVSILIQSNPLLLSTSFNSLLFFLI